MSWWFQTDVKIEEALYKHEQHIIDIMHQQDYIIDMTNHQQEYISSSKKNMEEKIKEINYHQIRFSFTQDKLIKEFNSVKHIIYSLRDKLNVMEENINLNK